VAAVTLLGEKATPVEPTEMSWLAARAAVVKRARKRRGMREEM
jgi:hypothetical protein